MDPQPETVAAAGSSPGGVGVGGAVSVGVEVPDLVDGAVAVVAAVGLAVAVAVFVDGGGLGGTGEEQAEEGLEAQRAGPGSHQEMPGMM